MTFSSNFLKRKEFEFAEAAKPAPTKAFRRLEYGGEVQEGGPGSGPHKGGGKDPKTMTAGQIKKEYQKHSDASSKHTDEMIKAGFGHIKSSDMRAKPDAHPLFAQGVARMDRMAALKDEAHARYGPDLRHVDQLSKTHGPSKKESTEADPQPDVGVQSKYWFWGAEPKEAELPVDEPVNTTPATPDAVPTDTDPEALARKLLLDNPEISAATFYNLLTSKGLGIVFKPIPGGGGVKPEPVKEEPVEEADGASGHAALLRESAQFRESTASAISIFKESRTNPMVGPTRFRATLLREGMGNLADGFFYTKEALESAVPLFEGAKCYGDHPDKLEKQIRPERSVHDIIGHFENVRLEGSDDGTTLLVGDLVLMDGASNEWARDRVRHAAAFNKKYPDKDFVALSIHAGGQASKIPLDQFVKEYPLKDSMRAKILAAMEKGVETVSVANSFDSAVSCDLVTNAGAGGAVGAMIETNKGSH